MAEKSSTMIAPRISTQASAPISATADRPRAITFLFPGEPLVCPKGHKIPTDFWILGDTMHLMGGARCDFIEPLVRNRGEALSAKEAHQYECGAHIFFIALAGQHYVVCEVSPRELAAMQKDRMTPLQIREFLGLGFGACHYKPG